MRTLTNSKLTPHFSRYEIIEGTVLPEEAKKMNWKNIKEYDETKFIPLLEDMEVLRSFINMLYKTDIGGRNIGLEITSGWRCREWELFRKRSGEGQHPIAALDVRPTNCSAELSVQIMRRFHTMFWPRDNGYIGGYAIAFPSYNTGDGKLKTTGFLHLDKRGSVVRWTY